MDLSSSHYATVIAPPSGTKTNLVDPPNQTTGTVVLHTICLFFVTCCILIRFYTRQFINHETGWDDYCCMLAYAMTIAFSAVLLVANTHGLGYHLWDLSVTEYRAALKMFTIAQWINLPHIASIKLSCLISYWRIFNPSQKMRWILGIAMTLIVCIYIGLFFASLFECWPLEDNWDPTIQALSGHCIKPKGRRAYGFAAINVVSDIVVLVIPIPAIWSLKMRSRRKVRIMAIFSVATFAVISSIIRLARTPDLFVDRDLSWNLGKIQVWVVLEVNVGIICACSLAFPAFLDRYKAAFVKRVRSYTEFFRPTTDGEFRTESELAHSSFRAPINVINVEGLVPNNPFPKLSGDSGDYPMFDFAVSEAPDSRQNLTRRADIEYEGENRPVYPKQVHVPKQSA